MLDSYVANKTEKHKY